MLMTTCVSHSGSLNRTGLSLPPATALVMRLSTALLTAIIAITAPCTTHAQLGVQSGASTAMPSRIPNLAGKVLTVRGPVDPSEIGQTLMHEHIFIDFQSPRPRAQRFSSPEEEAAFNQPISMSNLNRLRYGRGVAGSSFLGDFDEMRDEVMEFKKAGGGAIVDVSSIGLGRDPQGLFRMSNETGLAVIMGASWYIKQYHPLDMDTRTVEQLADSIVRDVTVGVQGTNIRSGVIGEIGIDGGPLTPNELKVIRASARAARITGAPMTFHAGGVNEERLTTIATALAEGVKPDQIIMGHSGALTPNMPLVKRILATGVYFQIDWLGVITGPAGIMGNRSDHTIAQAIVEIIKLGYEDRILLSHDICTKYQLKKYGGTGFAYINEYFLPDLRRLGVSEEIIHKIMVDNPRRALTFKTPA